MFVTIMLLLAFVLFCIGATDRKIGTLHATPLGLAALTLAMLWPTISS